MTTETYTISASGKASIVKDSAAVLDYPFDWTDWLDLVSDNVAPPPDEPTFVVTGGLVLDSLLKNGTRGTGKKYKTDAAGYAVGATNINVAGGVGTILSGDFVKFSGDDQLYAVTSFGAGVLVLSGAGLVQAIPAIATVVSVRAVVVPLLSGGTSGNTAECTCHIITEGGREDERTIFLKIKER